MLGRLSRRHFFGRISITLPLCLVLWLSWSGWLSLHDGTRGETSAAEPAATRRVGRHDHEAGAVHVLDLDSRALVSFPRSHDQNVHVNDSDSGLRRRVDGQPTAPTDTWNKFVNRGREMLTLMRTPLICATDLDLFYSEWVDYDDLEEYGWSDGGDPDGWALSYWQSLGTAFDALGLSRSFPPNLDVRWVHNHDSKVTYRSPNGALVPYKATEGLFHSWFNPTQGVITILQAFSPSFMSETQDGFSGAIVPLAHWSDVTFLAWDDLTDGDERAALQKVIINCIVNQDSRAAVLQALQSLDPPVNAVARWPGTKFDVSESSLPALALLGCTNVHGIARFLFQHKHELGSKVISSITVWDDVTAQQSLGDATRVRPNILLEIVDLEPAGSAKKRRRRRRADSFRDL